MNGEIIGFIGAGNMASAVIRNVVAGGVIDGSQIMVVNKKNQERLKHLQETYGVRPASGIQEIVEKCSIIVLATKPFQVEEALQQVAGKFRDGQLLVSVAAGVPIHYLQMLAGPGAAVIRAMPNTPVQVGEGAVVFAAAEGVSEEAKARAGNLFAHAGRVFWTDENQMDVVTAISGSGPAYFYLLADQLAEAGLKLGLEQHLARELARQTLVGAGELLKSTNAGAEELLGQVVTPGGTTAAALSVFEARRLGEVVAEAISSAARRSGEMSSVSERLEMRASRKMVVKIGSSTVVGQDGKFNDTVMRHFAHQVAQLVKEGRQVVIVSSGAIACGRNMVPRELTASLTDKQVLAAMGQPLLMRYYESIFKAHGINVAQILLTREDFSDPRRGDLCRNTLTTLLSRGMVPIVNENDTVAIDEIVLGDNDTLSAEVATLVSADLLVLLTDTDGLYTGDPKTSSLATVIGHVGRFTPSVDAVAGPSGSEVGTGGMATKVRAASLAASHGIPTVIANGGTEDVLQAILQGRQVGTFFSRR
ncbi:MAG: glutamate 5-kinase [Bacillota bacterium]|nr:glutamate 5-kinase [Bacillota bacterium]